jgi:hypothetical protein
MLYLRLVDTAKDGTQVLLSPLPSWKLGWQDSFKDYLTHKAALLTKGTNIYIVSPTP